jgi:Fe-S cluster assembly protein SufD
MDSVAHYTATHGAAQAAPSWLQTARASALCRLQSTGFPGSKNEAWKYTNAARILGTSWAPAVASKASLPQRALATDGHRLVLVDGVVSSDLSDIDGLPDGVTLTGFGDEGRHLGQVLGEASGFEALNAAFLADGAVVRIAAGVSMDMPLHLIHIATGGGTHAAARVLISLGRSSSCQVVEHWLGEGEGLTTAVTEVDLADNASLRHLRVQDGHDLAHHVGTLAVRQARDSRLHSHVLTLGGAIGRIDVRVRLEGEGAETHLWGLYLGRGTQHCDHHTSVVHAVPNTTSFEHYKGILDGKARGVFTGRVVIEVDAQKVASSQSNDNLLLSDEAVVNTRPQLEIYADDVQCAHGATIGRLDPDAFFYLRQRGLNPSEATALLTFAFANEVLASLAQGPVRAALEARVQAWLEAR